MSINSHKYPHIVLLILDSARRDLFGCYGSRRGLTPNCDQLAQEGMVLVNNYAPGCGSAQSHVSLFLGQHSVRHKMVHNLCDLDEKTVPMTRLLKRLGYRNFGHCQASFIPPASYEDLFGFDEFWYPGKNNNGSSRSLLNKTFDFGRSLPNVWNGLKKVFERFVTDEMRVRTAARYFDGKSSIDYILEKLKKQAADSPVFAYSTLLHPHTPYYPPAWCRDKVLKGRSLSKLTYQIQLNLHGWENGDFGDSPEAIEGLRLLYEGELLYGDYLIGEVTNKLRELGLLDQTVLIVTADHGELFGEHGRLNHGRTIWEELVRTPCIVRFPSMFESGRRFENLTSGLDLVPTIFDILGERVFLEGETLIDGKSWLGSEASMKDRFLVIDSPPAVLPERFKQYPKLLAQSGLIQRGIWQGDRKYIWQSDGQHLLFDYRINELPENNLLDKEPDEASRLHDKMVQFYLERDQNFTLDEYVVNIGKKTAGKVMDPLVQQELTRLGYL